MSISFHLYYNNTILPPQCHVEFSIFSCFSCFLLRESLKFFYTIPQTVLNKISLDMASNISFLPIFGKISYYFCHRFYNTEEFGHGVPGRNSQAETAGQKRPGRNGRAETNSYLRSHFLTPPPTSCYCNSSTIFYHAFPNHF